MGSRLVSICARTRDRDLILDDLGLVAAGGTDAWFEEELAGAQIGDWYVVQVMVRSPYRGRIDDRLLARLSMRAEIVACSVHETNMSSFAAAWEGGRERWSVLHELNLDPRHLASEGEVPPALATFVKKANERAEEEVDFVFEVPIDLCERLTGFRHDASAMDELHWEALREKRPTPRKTVADRYMEVEDKPATHWPLAFQARAAVDAMTPNGGPGFVILQGANGDYMQTAGGDGLYIVEWREHRDRTFRHYIAGRASASPDDLVQVPTNGRHLTCRANEVLSATDVKRHATAFLNGEARPDAFVWRDMTDTFA